MQRHGLSKFFLRICQVCIGIDGFLIFYCWGIPLLIWLHITTGEGYDPGDQLQNFKTIVILFVVAVVADMISCRLAGIRLVEVRDGPKPRRVKVDVRIVYVRHGNTYVPVRLPDTDDDVIPVERRLR
jgi:hypothetical protein